MSFHLLTESGDSLLTEGGDFLVTENDVPTTDFWCPEGLATNPWDNEQRSLWKWCMRLYLRVGNMATPFPEGTRPLPTDDEERLYQKINRMLYGANAAVWYSGASPSNANSLGDNVVIT